MLPSYDESAACLLGIAADLGVGLRPGAKILDYGCGSGRLVKALRDRGYEAFGTDVKPFWEKNGEVDASWFAPLIGAPPKIPFVDASFELVLSTSVFEHVANYRAAFEEVYRVTQSGGHSLHVFPGPWTLPVEPHMYVPLASMLQQRWWLSLWAILGIRNEYQQGKTWREVVDLNEAYCQTGINYLPRSTVKQMVLDIFGNVQYPKQQYLARSPGRAARLGRKLHIPFIASALFAFREQVLYMRKESTDATRARPA